MASRFTLSVHIIGLTLWWEERHGEPATSDQIAESISTNPVVVRRLLADLKKAGLLETKRGAHGGILVSRAPSAITLRDIYEAVEQDREIIGLYPKGPNPSCDFGCYLEAYLRGVLGDAEEALKQSLQRITLADVGQSIRRQYEGAPPRKGSGVPNSECCSPVRPVH